MIKNCWHRINAKTHFFLYPFGKKTGCNDGFIIGLKLVQVTVFSSHTFILEYL